MPRRRTECCALDPRELGNDPPEWILLLPAGSPVRLRDGRTFASAGAEAVIADWRRGNIDIPVDLDHASAWSDSAPAYGWVAAMEARDGAVWGRVEWTDEGRQIITSRRYRYYSPEFSVRPTSDALGREIYGIQGLALVNRPALQGVRALAREGNRMGDPIREKLGLADTATDQEVLAAIDRRAAAVQPPGEPAAPAPDMVPRADYDLVATRANTAETALAQRAQDDLRAEVASLVDGAIRDGKVAPASRDYHLGACRTQEDVADLRKFVDSAPVVLAAASAAAAGAPPNAGEQWDPEQQRLIRAAGLDPKDVPVERA